jgi:hypothetical protein
MEILVFALAAFTRLYAREEKIDHETGPFPPLDVQVLKLVYQEKENSSSRSPRGQKSKVAQATS